MMTSSFLLLYFYILDFQFLHFLFFIFEYFFMNFFSSTMAQKNSTHARSILQTNGPNTGPEIWLKWYKKWSGQCSLDFEGEFVEMFPVDHVSICCSFWSIPRHLFRCLRKNV